MPLESYDLIAIAEPWWDESQDWSAAVDGYKLFRRDRPGRRGVGVALYVLFLFVFFLKKKKDRLHRAVFEEY